jgi:phenylacetic acid degradation operon negative regulatory protein
VTAAPGPALSRRHAAGAGSARGLLFTVLGEFVLPAGGAAWTSTLIDVLGRLGVEEKACRQALMRTAADGWLRAERVGRRTRWWLTDAADTMLTEGTARI